MALVLLTEKKPGGWALPLSSYIESYTETLSAYLTFFVFRVPIYLNGGFSAGTGLNLNFSVFAYEPQTFLAQSL